MQLTLEGKTKEQVAIERIKQYAKLTLLPLWVASSFGKDSEVITALVKRSGEPFEIHNQVTGIDPKELVYFGREYHPEAIRHYPKVSIWRLIEKKGLPTRMRRWCCALLKESGGKDRLVVTGIRWEESFRRSKIPIFHQQKHKAILNPIADWTLVDIWEYIDANKLPYCSLYDTAFNRKGCIGCPLSSSQRTEFKLYPKIEQEWHNAAIRYYESKLQGKSGGFENGEHYWQWWLSGLSIAEFTHSGNKRMEI